MANAIDNRERMNLIIYLKWYRFLLSFYLLKYQYIYIMRLTIYYTRQTITFCQWLHYGSIKLASIHATVHNWLTKPTRDNEIGVPNIWYFLILRLFFWFGYTCSVSLTSSSVHLPLLQMLEYSMTFPFLKVSSLI
jgi:hypothetical protein